MIQSIQKIIKIGSSSGVTIPSKELKRQNISYGDDVEVIIRPIKNDKVKSHETIDAAKKIITKYQKDFNNLANR